MFEQPNDPTQLLQSYKQYTQTNKYNFHLVFTLHYHKHTTVHTHSLYTHTHKLLKNNLLIFCSKKLRSNFDCIKKPEILGIPPEPLTPIISTHGSNIVDIPLKARKILYPLARLIFPIRHADSKMQMLPACPAGSGRHKGNL